MVNPPLLAVPGGDPEVDRCNATGFTFVIEMLIQDVLVLGMDYTPENPKIPAVQAVTLTQMIEAIQGGAIPHDKYIIGGLVGAGLTLATGGGAGVLVGLSMYLPIFYVLPYGLGCLIAMASDRLLGRQWSVETGLPIAAGLLVGDSLAGVIFALCRLTQSL